MTKITGIASLTFYDEKMLQVFRFSTVNRILHCGKQALLDLLFNSRLYKISKICVGDGAVEWGAGGTILSSWFPDENYPSVPESVRNNVGESQILTVSTIVGDSSNGWEIRVSGKISSHTDVNPALFNTNNILKKINSCSIVFSGVDTPLVFPFSAGDDIPFSNISLPGIQFDPSVPTTMYVNWIYRIV
jgi:hypothetical protein